MNCGDAVIVNWPQYQYGHPCHVRVDGVLVSVGRTIAWVRFSWCRQPIKFSLRNVTLKGDQA